MEFKFNDGGRKEAGFKGATRDCVCRSISIASGIPYKEVYSELNSRARNKERVGKRTRKKSSSRTGIFTKKKWFKDYMVELGFQWTPTMKVGSGCKVHLREGELPSGNLVVAVSKHYTAVIGGVIHDTHDCSRGGSRCVYGYWEKK